MTKKGVDLSVNVIIVAAIALAVLVVLFMIFTGRLAIFSKGVSETDTCAQKCASLNMQFERALTLTPSVGQQCNQGETYIPGSYKEGQYGCCCRPKT